MDDDASLRYALRRELQVFRCFVLDFQSVEDLLSDDSSQPATRSVVGCVYAGNERDRDMPESGCVKEALADHHDERT